MAGASTRWRQVSAAAPVNAAEQWQRVLCPHRAAAIDREILSGKHTMQLLYLCAWEHATSDAQGRLLTALNLKTLWLCRAAATGYYNAAGQRWAGSWVEGKPQWVHPLPQEAGADVAEPTPEVADNLSHAQAACKNAQEVSRAPPSSIYQKMCICLDA